MTRNFILTIGGAEDRFELEHRIFNISSFLLTTFAVLGAIGNYFTGLHPMTVWLSIAGVICSGYLFYLARVKEFFSLKISLAYITLVIGILGSMFFFNGGTQGTILYLIIMLLNVFLLIVPASYQVSVSVTLYVLIALLILLEFLNPGWIVPYHSTGEMLVDHVISIFYSIFYTTVTIILFRKKHLEDRSKILQQNTALQLLNEKIVAQKNELEEKTRQLQLAIESAQERNEYIEMLLKELNHRVKNNLQLVSSLLYKQASTSTDPGTKAALLDTKNRMLSLILLHQRLYGSENTTRVFMPRYLRELTESILGTYTAFPEENVVYETDDIWLDVEKAISVGLIANELITNAFKHAFTNSGEQRLFVSVTQSGTNCVLSVKDNGNGSEGKGNSGFGIELISLLTKQLKGEFTRICIKDQGCAFSVSFDITPLSSDGLQTASH